MIVFLAFAILVASISAKNVEVDILSSSFIDSINQQQSSWKAGQNFPVNTTKEYLAKLTGTLGMHPDPNYRPVVKTHNLQKANIPDTFDARQQWSNCESLNRIRDQGGCGSCWAFSSTEVMSDRLCIHSSGSQQFIFAPEDVLACCDNCGDCGGGWVGASNDYYISTGLVSGGDVNSNEGCLPYTSDAHDNGQNPSCTRTCVSSYGGDYNSDKHYGSSDYMVNSALDQIQYEIMTNGPVVVTYSVYADFYSYQSGVYYHVEGDYVGYHAVKAIGWGTENGIPYWLIANSWGSWWGEENGFFKIRRGTNEAGIEEFPYGVLPRL